MDTDKAFINEHFMNLKNDHAVFVDNMMSIDDIWFISIQINKY
jgi:hypothetical protein